MKTRREKDWAADYTEQTRRVSKETAVTNEAVSMKEAAGPGRRFQGLSGWGGNGLRHKFPLCSITCWGVQGTPPPSLMNILPSRLAHPMCWGG